MAQYAREQELARQRVAALAAAAPATAHAAVIRPREEDTAEKEEIARLRAELQHAQEAELQLRSAAELAARKGLLPPEQAMQLVPESAISFSWRSSLRTLHAMRLIREDADGYQEIDKCLACGRTWEEILKMAAEDKKHFRECPSRAGWDALRAAEKKKYTKANTNQ